MRLNDIASGVLLLAFAVVLWVLAATLPNPAAQEYGPAFFPKVIATCLGLSAVVLIITSSQQAGGVSLFAFDDWICDPRRVVQFLLVPATVIFYIYAVEELGFLLTATLVLLILQLALRVKPLLSLIVAIAMVVFIYAIFDMLLGVPLPRGELFV